MKDSNINSKDILKMVTDSKVIDIVTKMKKDIDYMQDSLDKCKDYKNIKYKTSTSVQCK